MDDMKRRQRSRWAQHAGCGLILASSMWVAAVPAAQTERPAAEDPHAAHQHAESAAAPAGGVAAPEGMTIEIVEPGTDAQVEAGGSVPVRIRANGMSVSGDHWHLYLDGELQAMVGAGRTEYELVLPDDLQPGDHEIKVTISNSSHEEYDLAALRTIKVQASAPSHADSPGP